MYEVLVITISNPVLVGVYKNKQLVKEYKCEGKSSDFLPLLFEEILQEFEIKNLNYVNTPGSFMAIKVAYIFLKTISLTRNMEFRAVDGFEFNKKSPIKALGKKYFIKTSEGVKVEFLQKDSIIRDFELPMSIEKINFKKETLPIYNLPAV